MIPEGTIPDDPLEFSWVLNFLTHLRTRTKPNRNVIQDLYETAIKQLAGHITSSSENFVAAVNRASRDDPDFPELPKDLFLDDIRIKLLDGTFQLTAYINNNYFLTRMGEDFNLTLPSSHLLPRYIEFAEDGGSYNLDPAFEC